MPTYPYRGASPSFGAGCFVAPSCDVIGRVELGDNASLWHGVVARGDMNRIVVGEGSNVQDLTMLHVTEELPLLVGAGVTVGHQAILHACAVEDRCLVGMGAVVLDGALIGEGCVVSAGSVVPPGKRYPPRSMIRGNPARAIRPLTDEEAERYGNHHRIYLALKDEYLAGG